MYRFYTKSRAEFYVFSNTSNAIDDFDSEKLHLKYSNRRQIQRPTAYKNDTFDLRLGSILYLELKSCCRVLKNRSEQMNQNTRQIKDSTLFYFQFF